MGFVKEEKGRERKRGGGQAAEDPEHWQSSTCRGGTIEGARIGSSVFARSLARSPRQDRQVQRDSRRAGFSRLRRARRELSDNFSSVLRVTSDNASEYVST